MIKNRILFFITLVAAISMIVGYRGSNMGFILSYALGILLFFALLSILLAPLVLRVTENIGQEKIAKNMKVIYSITVKNSSMFLYPKIKFKFFNGEILNYGDIDKNNHIGPFSKNTIDYTVCAPYRGVYRAGIKQILVMDFLGLFKRKINVDSALMLTIYPKYDRNIKLSIVNEPQQAEAVHKYTREQDNTTVSDVRQYMPADSPKQVHWQLSAKKGELMTKEYSPLVTKKIVLFLDTKIINLPDIKRPKIEDAITGYVLSGVNYCIENNLFATLICGRQTSQQKEIAGSIISEPVLELLASTKFEKASSTLENLLYLPKDYNYVIYITNIDEKTYAIIQDLVSYEHKTIVYYFYNEDMPVTAQQKNILDTLQDFGVEVNRIKIL